MIGSVMFFDLSPHTLGSHSPIFLAFLSLLINFLSVNVIYMLISLKEKIAANTNFSAERHHLGLSGAHPFSSSSPYSSSRCTSAQKSHF